MEFDPNPRPRVLGSRYELEHQVGRGASATVYAALDHETGARVAVKLLHSELAASVSALRFHREIGILSRLSHPNIVRILASHEEASLLYFVTRLVAGDSLRVTLNARQRLPLEETARILRGLASAIDHAHQQGVVHRDIKPENILFENGEPVLCDFGIARALLLSITDGPITSSGLAVGTPLYMSPEQALDPQHVDGRTDIYSLGCVAYEMLTGEPPFFGTTHLALLTRHAAEPPLDIRLLRPDAPEGACAAILAALAKVPSVRPQTATAFVDRFMSGIAA